MVEAWDVEAGEGRGGLPDVGRRGPRTTAAEAKGPRKLLRTRPEIFDGTSMPEGGGLPDVGRRCPGTTSAELKGPRKVLRIRPDIFYVEPDLGLGLGKTKP